MLHAVDETIECAGLRIALRRWGPADAPVRVLALHGWIDNVASFEPLAALLPDQVQMVAVDFPGHGQSDWLPESGEYHYVDWVVWTDRVVQGLGWDRFSLIGHSMGAGVAALYAGAVPSTIDRLVLLDGLGPYTTSAAEAPANLAAALSERRRVGRREHRVLATIEDAVARKLAALPHLGEDCARLLIERGTHRVDGGVAYSHDPRLLRRSALRLSEEQVLGFLQRIQAPSLIVRPRDGLDYPAGGGDTEARLAAFAHQEVLVVEGHHHIHLTNPERVASRVVGWLNPSLDTGFQGA